jgi:hypothetical protein
VPTPVGILARISNRACFQLARPLVVSRAEVMSRYQPSAQLPDCRLAEITRYPLPSVCTFSGLSV